MSPLKRTATAVSAVLVTCFPGTARALDKQGSAHGGDVAGHDSGFAVTGAASFGFSPYNPTYAARPDATGHTLLRAALHLDVDLIGRLLSIPLDVNVFSDRDRRGASKLLPTELDLIGGVTSTWALGPGALELGLRGEHDRPIDRGTYTQSYVDFRSRYLFSLKPVVSGLESSLGRGDVLGYVTLGAFLINPTYAARPDNSGLALFRYVAHVETWMWNTHIGLGLDATFFTDRQASLLGPSELDFTPELIGRWEPFEIHLAYERDMPLDRGGLVQHFVYVLGVWAFEAVAHDEVPAPPPR